MIEAPLALAFTAGMIATVNPCGFAMLPAYLGYFLGIEGSTPDRTDRADAAGGLLRALVVAAVVSGGFLLLFAVAGALVSWTSFGVGRWSPFLTVVIGLALIGVGGAFVLGWEPTVMLPKLNKGGHDRGLWSMFAFGLSYAIASLSCTIGPFTSVVATTFSRESFVSGVITFVAYGAGMAGLLTVLTVALALARRGLVTTLRSALPYVQRASGAVMVLTGAYLTWYGIYEIRALGNRRTAASGPVRLVTRWSASVSSTIDGFDALDVALVIALVVAAVVLVVLLRSGSSRTDETVHEPAE
jgi:cytochrome c biogenesis protein CcdA